MTLLVWYVTNLVKYFEIGNFVYSGYGILFNGAGSWRSGDGLTVNRMNIFLG